MPELQRGEFVPQYRREALRLARRRGELEAHIARRAVAMREAQREAAHTGLARRQQAFELDQKPPRGEDERLGMRDLGRKLEPRVEALRRRKEFARLGSAAER